MLSLEGKRVVAQSALMVLERQVQATIHFCSFLDGGTCHKKIGFCLADIPDMMGTCA